MQKLGLYVHFPFCLSKCPYCDFYSLPFCKEAADLYIKNLLRSISSENCPLPEAAVVDSVYFGGGTPSLFGERLLEVLSCLRSRFTLTEDCEITLEANPAAQSFEALCALRGGGFNRLSLGVQAASNKQLRALGRVHSFGQAVESVEAGVKAGFSNISVDLMLGTPGQTVEEIDNFAEVFSALPISHVSAYLLQVEEGTPFSKRHIETICPGEDDTAAIYLHTVERLSGLGFLQYEISNFSKPGCESRHNLKYWHCEDYLGFGPSAHSFMGGKRFFFPRELEAFCAAPDPWCLVVPDSSGGDFFEYAMLRLRLVEGLLFSEAVACFPSVDLAPLKREAAVLQEHGLAKLTANSVALTVSGFLLSNSAIERLLDAI